MTTMTSNNQKIDYVFACQFMAALEKVCHSSHKDFDLTVVSSNPIITIDYVNQHPEKSWHWPGLTSNPAISLAYIEQHPEKPWNRDEYEFRKYGGEAEPVEIEYYKNAIIENENDCFPPLYWDAPNITTAYIEQHLDWIDEQVQMTFDDNGDEDCPIIWSQISNNPNLTIEFINKFYNKPWHYYILSGNPLCVAKKSITN